MHIPHATLSAKAVTKRDFSYMHVHTPETKFPHNRRHVYNFPTKVSSSKEGTKGLWHRATHRKKDTKQMPHRHMATCPKDLSPVPQARPGDQCGRGTKWPPGASATSALGGATSNRRLAARGYSYGLLDFRADSSDNRLQNYVLCLRSTNYTEMRSVNSTSAARCSMVFSVQFVEAC